MDEYWQTILTEITSHVTLEDGGVQIHEPLNSRFRRSTHVLIDEILKDKKIHRLIKRVRYSIPYNPFLGHLESSVLKEMKIKNVTSIEECKELFFKNIEGKKFDPMHKYNFFFPLNIKFKTELKPIKMNNLIISFPAYQSIKSLLVQEQIITEIFRFSRDKEFEFIPHNYSYIQTTVYARNVDFGLNTSSYNIDFLIGVLDLLNNIGSFPTTIIGDRHPFSDVEPRLIFCFEDDEFLNIAYNSQFEKNMKMHEIDVEILTTFGKIINYYLHAKKPVQDIISDAIITFHNGLVEKKIGHSFFYFWTALEIICLKNQNITEKEVKARLISAIKKPTHMAIHEINRMYELRNNMVHNADYSSITEFHRNLLKSFVDQMILFFIAFLSVYRKDEIHEIFSYLSKGDETLIRNKELIDYVLSNIRKS